MLPASTASILVAPSLSIRCALHVATASVADKATCCSDSYLWLYIYQVVGSALVDRLCQSDSLWDAFLLIPLSLGDIEDVR